ncbi:DUF4468 domain-containing protein [Chryseobacterium cucumeris]|uniref:DUF4468 domain-containing protein n=1 Tax=Chryseobacterium cucumeris TaxID=1813611 RepID=UPI003208BD1D
MKKILLILIIIISYFPKCQNLELIDGDYSYTKVIEVNKSKKEIYSSIKKWLNNSMTKSKYVIDQDDPETGIISFNEILPEVEYMYMKSSQVSYKINIDIKENKLRYRVNNITFNNKFAGLANYRQTYEGFLSDINKETDTYNTSQKLLGEATKQRQKKEYEYESNNARNNLRSLNALQDLIKSQIILNEKTIVSKVNETDEW